MLMVNLHETEFLNDVLTTLAQMQVRDCTVQQVDSIPSYHPEDALVPNTLASVAGLFKPQHKHNYLITAVADEERAEAISDKLKAFYKEDRRACSFWFIPMTGYCYHKC